MFLIHPYADSIIQFVIDTRVRFSVVIFETYGLLTVACLGMSGASSL